jgi:hypothetical protein
MLTQKTPENTCNKCKNTDNVKTIKMKNIEGEVDFLL